MSARLQIKPIAPWHAEPLFHALDFDSVYEFVTSPRPTAPSEVASRIDRSIAGAMSDSQESWLNFVVLLGSHVIGHVQATVVESRAEIAYLFGPVASGKGYATQATQWLIDHVGQAHGISEFWATSDSENLRSIRLLERCGFVETSLPPHGLPSYDEGDLVFRLTRQTPSGATLLA
jgi:ribosomal-protein-alanine N-acetyltransferase